MSARPRVAFYAPMKSPRHPKPSGDRTMGRLLLAALERAGYDAEVVSDLQCYDGAGDPARQQGLRTAAQDERARLLSAWTGDAPKPDLWFTYHVYHKAPDLLGPILSARLGVPYVIAEPSHAPKRATGPWAGFYADAEAAIRAADLTLAMTGADAECVAPLRAEKPLIMLPPFLDCAGWHAGEGRRDGPGPLRLVTVAMMRAGDKAASYALLAQALARVTADCTLTIVGDGPARAEVEVMFAPFGARVTFEGMLTDRAALAGALAAADLFVWPAVNEAYGVAPMEAQAMGLPVVAGREGGVADVVRDGETGLLVAPRDPAAIAAALDGLGADPARRQAMGAAARRFMQEERGLDTAAALLARHINPLLGRC